MVSGNDSTPEQIQEFIESAGTSTIDRTPIVPSQPAAISTPIAAPVQPAPRAAPFVPVEPTPPQPSIIVGSGPFSEVAKRRG
jgi:hypothetical protein